VTNAGSFGAELSAARPRAIGAFLRYFRDLAVAEEAFHEACLRALDTWPTQGLPSDPLAWLIVVGRNAALDQARRSAKQLALPPEEQLSELGDVEQPLVERLDAGHYPDDVLRLLFICCHPDLGPHEQVALALRVVSGLSVKEIACAFLVGESAMEQRITRAKRRIASASVPYEAPAPAARAERLGVVLATVYLLFNEGYSATGGEAHIRTPLCEEAIRLARLLHQLFPAESEIMGLTALLLLQHSRAAARLDEHGAIVLLEDQDRGLWDQSLIREGNALVEAAMRERRPGPFLIQGAIAAVHASAPRSEDTDWAEIHQLYLALEGVQPSPIVRLNRAVAVAKLDGPEAALAMIEPLTVALQHYFHFHGLKGALLMQLGLRLEARESFGVALTLAHTTAEADHIRQRLEQLG
jgi:RNA polymerase sigma-70 factor (ECF subfamily)